MGGCLKAKKHDQYILRRYYVQAMKNVTKSWDLKQVVYSYNM